MGLLGLKEVDLNLLLTLHVLLEERSVTRAAERLGRSQSAMSHALGRLREVFADPLLIRGRGGMLPTPRAKALEEELRAALGQLQRVLASPGEFDPRTTRRTFSVACPDAISGSLTALLGWMEAEAPQARLSLRLPPPNAAALLESGELDLLLGATNHVRGGDVVMRKLSETRLVSYLRAGHPLLETSPPSLEAWLQTPHVQVVTGDRARNILGALLDQRGLERRLGVEVPNFMMALATVAATRSMFTAPDVMAGYAAEVFGLEVIAPPVELPTVSVGMFWHRRWHRDAEHRWLRDGVEAALDVLRTPPGGPG